MANERPRCPGISGALERCGRFAPPPVHLGTIRVQGDATPRQFFGLRQCRRCKRREDVADKRRAILQRNLQRAYGDAP